jgi:diguanylate cyclase (GGDEF)-like protein/PAS domain S-box-containing protein
LKFGLRGKILLITLSAVLIGMTAVFSTGGYLFGSVYVSALQSRSVAIAQGMRMQLDRILQLGIQMDNLVGFDKQCREVVATYRGIDFAMVVDRNDTILFHSNSARHGEKLTDPQLLAAIHSRVESISEYVIDGVDGYGTVAPMLASDGKYLGSVVLGVSADFIDHNLHPTAWTMLGVGLVFLGGGFVVLLLSLSHFVTRPLQLFIQSIEQLRHDTSDLSRRVAWHSVDELGSLAGAFNGLMDKLQDTTVSKSSLEAAYDTLKASESKNREQKILLDTVLNNLDGHVYLKDLDGRYLYVNASTAAALGQSQDSMRGKRDDEILPPEEAERLRVMEQQVLRTGQRVCCGETLTDATGAVRHYWLMKIALKDGNKISATVGISTDITEVVRLKEQFELLANTDPMTGISNRRHLISEAEREIRRMRRDGGQMAAIMFDIDKFKAINDLHGHAIGDRAILAVVQACNDTRREIDLFGRFGGDEFVVLLPKTDAVEARIVAERLRQAIASADIQTDGNDTVSITASVGLAMFNATSSLENVLNRADVALYQAKLRGRNCVWCDGVLPPVPN